MILRKDVIDLLTRTIERPAAPPGKRAWMGFLLALLCAALPLLSGCRGRDVTPSNPQESVTPTAADSGVTPGTTNDGETAEVTAHSLARGVLPSAVRKTLDTLSAGVLYVSKKLTAFESETPTNSANLNDILRQEERWLQYLAELTEQAWDEWNKFYPADADNMAPGLRKFSGRIESMLRVVHSNLAEEPSPNFEIFKTPQAALAKFREWVNELADRAQALPDVPPDEHSDNSESVPESSASAGENEELDEIFTILGELSEKVNELSAEADGISNRVYSIPTKPPSVSLGWVGYLFLIVSAVNFALLACLLFMARRLFLSLGAKTEVKSSEEKSNSLTGNPIIYDVKATLVELSRKMDRLLEEVSARQERMIERPCPPAAAEERAVASPVPPPPPVPPIQYFAVINPDAADGQRIYLQKKSVRSGQIYGRPLNGNPRVYDVFPAMSNVTDNGKRGVLGKIALISNEEIRKCFDFPKQLPEKKTLLVTVEASALIQSTGGDYVLTRRGKLSVQ